MELSFGGRKARRPPPPSFPSLLRPPLPFCPPIVPPSSSLNPTSTNSLSSILFRNSSTPSSRRPLRQPTRRSPPPPCSLPSPIQQTTNQEQQGVHLGMVVVVEKRGRENGMFISPYPYGLRPGERKGGVGRAFAEKEGAAGARKRDGLRRETFSPWVCK